MTYKTGPELTSRQKQIIWGTTLGGSSIIKPVNGKNCYLAMRDRDLDWLAYKTQELANLFKSGNDCIKKDQNTYRCYSIAYPLFNEFYDKFYLDKAKIVTRELLDRLGSMAWMIWFVDAGRKTNNRLFLRTNKFGSEGSRVIFDYFRSLDIDCSLNTLRNRYEIIFQDEAAVRFIQTIAQDLPPFMRIRLS